MSESMRWVTGLVLLLPLLLPPGVLACDIGADPAVQIVTSGGEVLDEDPCSGYKLIRVDEGESIQLTAEPVEDDGGCEPIEWSEVIDVMTSSTDGWLEMDEIFTGPGGGVLAFVDFLIGSGTSPADSTFSFTISPSGYVTPSSGGIEDFDTLFNGIISGGVDLNGDWKVDPDGAHRIKGHFKADAENVKIYWEIQPDPGFEPLDVFSGTGLPLAVDPKEAGYNPQISPGPRTTRPDVGINLTFDTPNYQTSAGPDTAAFYAVYGEAALPFIFRDDAGFDLHICKDVLVPNPDPPPGEILDECADKVTLDVDFEGTVVKRNNPSGASTIGSNGHPSVLLVAVTDITPPLAAQVVTPTDLGETVSGASLANGEVQVQLFDNNPYGQGEDYEVEGWYLVERSHWARENGSGDAFEGNRHDDLAHSLMGDDCWAGSPGHEFRWVYLDRMTGSAAGQVDVGGLPAGLAVDFPSFDITEPMGTHWAFGAEGDGSVYQDYVDRGLKFAYRITDLGVGVSRPTGIPDEDPGFAPLPDWGGEQQDQYVPGSGIPEPVPGGTAVDDAILSAACPECAGYKLMGVPTWNVRDRLKPSLVILAHDTKYDKWYYFGENFAGDADGNGEYLAAYAAGSGGDPDNLDNQALSDYVGGVLWAGNGDDGGFETQISSMGANDFWPSCANVGSNSGDYAGLWIDEDTIVDFYVTAWDNLNGWKVQGIGGGIDSAEFELVDNPSSFQETTTISSIGEPFTHLFRNPNRPEGLRGSLGEAFVRASISDKEGNPREVKVQIYIADNSLKIFSLEEHRSRIAND